MALTVLHSDNHLLVVEKPAGVPVVPDESGDESLLEQAKAWVAREFAKPGKVFLGVVHRLDRPVSGVVLFARTSKAADRLTRQFRERTAKKSYLGVASRAPSPPEGRLEQWLLKDSRTRRVKVVGEGRADSRLACTRWRTLERRPGGRVLVELIPETGRPHQLRVAMATLGAPLLGDLKYGASSALPDRSIALHAHSLEVEHPTLKEPLRFSCEPPDSKVWLAD